ncbi:MAG: glycoside hydrolase family 3 protein [Spirochaetales bacterium]
MSILTIVALLAVVVSCAQESSEVRLPSADSIVHTSFERTIGEMSTAALAGQLLLIGLENPSTGGAPTTLNGGIADMLAQVQPGGFVLYGPSFESPGQVRQLISDAQKYLATPGFVATDYEGGQVSRLTDTGGIPATPIPTARSLGRRLESGAIGADRLRALGSLMGRELRALGLTMNFAPVVDVDPEGFVGAIGRHGRSFSSDPGLVVTAALSLIEGMEAEGVASIAKHFPGHGGVVEDSHFALPTLEASREQLDARELAVFSSVIAQTPAGIMTAHMVVPALDASATPATLSRPMLASLAREQMGFRGLIVTDALNMAAIRDLAPESEIVVQAVAAGADLLLKPVDPIAAHAALVRAIDDGSLDRKAVESSVYRILQAKWSFGILDPFRRTRFPIDVDVIGSQAHRQLVNEIMQAQEHNQ